MAYTLDDLLLKISDLLGIVFDFKYNPKKASKNDFNIHCDKYDVDFFANITALVVKDKTLSTKQVDLAKKLLIKYSFMLAHDMGYAVEDMERIINDAIPTKIPYESVSYPKEIRYVGNRRVAIRSKRIPKLVDKIKQIRDSSKKGISLKNEKDIVYFNKYYSLWVIEVLEANINAIYTTIKQTKLGIDDDTLAFFAKCEDSKNEKSSVELEDDGIVLTIQNDDLMSEWYDQVFYPEIKYVPKG